MGSGQKSAPLRLQLGGNKDTAAGTLASTHTTMVQIKEIQMKISEKYILQ